MPDSAKSSKNGTSPIEIRTSINVRTTFVDHFMVATRKDGLNLLRFSTNLPEGITEEARLVVTKEHLEKVIDALCDHCDYYPKKKPANKKSTRKKSSKG
jgi:hypothetical protein